MTPRDEMAQLDKEGRAYVVPWVWTKWHQLQCRNGPGYEVLSHTPEWLHLKEAQGEKPEDPCAGRFWLRFDEVSLIKVLPL